MVTLEFIADPDETRDDIAGYELSDVGTLTQTMFDMPVRLLVDGRDVLALPSGMPLKLPFVHVAVLGVDQVRALEHATSTRYDPPGGGTLRMTRTAGDVRLEWSITGAAATAPYEELRQAFEAFAVRVREFLLAQVPLIRQSPVWQRWVESGEMPDWDARVTRHPA